MADIFLSYNREDLATAKRFAEGLEAEGFSVWWDVALRSGEPYDKVTEQALKDAKAVVVLWSKRSVESRWVRSEATQADRKGTLLPAMIEACERPIMFELTHTADLTAWSGDAAHPLWRGFIEDVRRFIDREEPSAAPIAQAPPPLPAKPSIAVLPFANLSNDPEQDYFADGMMEEVVAALTRVRSIFVIASGSTATFKGRAVSPQEIARQLGVRYILEGNVRKSADRVRIAVKLIDAAAGTQIWAERFDDTLADVFALQDRVALRVAGVIEPMVQEAEVRRVSRQPTDDMGAYDLYLRARPLVFGFRRAELSQAADVLDRAIALDPDFGAALALAAVCHARLFAFRWSEELDAQQRRGVELAGRALRVAGDDAQVLAMTANALVFLEADERVGRPVALIDRALTLNPGSAYAWLNSGIARLREGEPETAIAHLETALRLDPLSSRRSAYLMFLAVARFEQGRFAEALSGFSEIEVVSPYGLAVLTATRGHLGDRNAAQQALSRYQALSPRPIEENHAWFHRLEHRKLFLDGIAKAEGKTPSDEAAAR